MYNNCAAHPGTSLVHFDGPCQCFFGGPAPEYLTVPTQWNFAGSSFNSYA